MNMQTIVNMQTEIPCQIYRQQKQKKSHKNRQKEGVTKYRTALKYS